MGNPHGLFFIGDLRLKAQDSYMPLEEKNLHSTFSLNPKTGISSRPQEITAFGRRGMCNRVTEMSPHMGARRGTTGFARGAP
jgi:hypothetical protein